MTLPSWLKKKKIIVAIIIVVLILGYLIFKPSNQKTQDFVTVQRGNITQEVSVTGRVTPAESVDLAFERGGKIASIPVAVGARVAQGQTLLMLENSELNAQLLQAQANAEAEQANLDALQKGTRPEELQSARTTVANAQRTLDDANTSLATITNKAQADLNDAYASALTSAQRSVTIGKNALITLTTIQYAHFTTRDQNGIAISVTKGEATNVLLGAANAGDWSVDALSTAQGGAMDEVQKATQTPTPILVDGAIAHALQGLQLVKTALDSVPVTATLTATETTNLTTEKTNVATEISTLTGKQQAIAVQKAYNTNTLASARAAVTTAQNTLASSEDALALKIAGATPEQIAAQTARVKSAQANVQSVSAQLAKTVIRAPFAGIITKLDIKVGELIPANTTVVSLMSTAAFEIETDVPEADIAKIKLQDLASVTLDAYGNEITFPTMVTKIEPAETIIEGVATYKTTLQFTQPDERIKSGMTANIDILTDKRENVLIVPQRTVSSHDGTKFVMLLDKKSVSHERTVELGLRGSDGMVEILSGLAEGDRVVAIAK